MYLSIIGNEKNRTFFNTILGEFFFRVDEKNRENGKGIGYWMNERNSKAHKSKVKLGNFFETSLK